MRAKHHQKLIDDIRVLAGFPFVGCFSFERSLIFVAMRSTDTASA